MLAVYYSHDKQNVVPLQLLLISDCKTPLRLQFILIVFNNYMVESFCTVEADIIHSSIPMRSLVNLEIFTGCQGLLNF